MEPWHEHEKWFEELRGLLGDQGSELSDEDIMFVSNLAAHTVHGDISLPEALAEITKWRQQQLGMLGNMDKEAFELELAVNHPELVDVTRGVQENLRFAEEPGIADGLVQVFARPDFEMFAKEGSWVAMQHKAWFALERLNEAEHQTVGWAIAMALKERNSGN